MNLTCRLYKECSNSFLNYGYSHPSSELRQMHPINDESFHINFLFRAYWQYQHNNLQSSKWSQITTITRPKKVKGGGAQETNCSFQILDELSLCCFKELHHCMQTEMSMLHTRYDIQPEITRINKIYLL